MYAKGNASSKSKLIAETKAGAVRLVSLRLNAVEGETIRASETFQRSVAAFLETEVKPPFFCHQISPTGFAFNSHADPERFDAFIEDMYQRLSAFLFGTERKHDGELWFFGGPDVEVARFLSESPIAARERSRQYLLNLSKKHHRHEGQAPLQRLVGKRPLLFRGILLCPKNVLLANAITPASNTYAADPSMEVSDAELGRYLRFRGAEAVQFSNRIFEKASFLLQTAPEHMRSIILLVPICYNSLLSPHDRELFLDNMKKHPDWIRKQLILSIFNTPAQPSTSIVQRFMGEFSQYFKNIDWHVSDPDVRPDIFTGCHLHCVTLDLQTTPPAQRMRVLERFSHNISKLRDLKIRPAVSGVDTREELEFCLSSGIIYASGDAITPALQTCCPALTVDIRDLPMLEPTVMDVVSSAA